jgi:DNA-binding FadR family transcriptional regulator
MTTSLSRPSAKLAILRPLSQPRNLTREVVERLSTEIMSGKLVPGARLPTEHEMIAALGALDAAIARGEPEIDEDVEFHRAIARATGNPQFVRFLEFLGRFIIPRRIIRVDHGEAQRAYLASIQDEHRGIFAAIQDRDLVAARAAMRQHFANNRERYRRLAAGSAGR